MTRQPTIPEPAAPDSTPPLGLTPVVVWGADYVALILVAGALRAWKLFPPDQPAQWLMLWATLLSLPLRLAAAVYLVKTFEQARPEDVGLTWRHVGRDVLLGAALALPLALLVYGVNLGSEWLLRPFTCGTQEHVFVDLARRGPTASQWFVLVASAMVAAPVWEEFLYRGLVQRWAIACRGGHVLVGLAVFLAIAFRTDSLLAAARVSAFGVLAELVPALAALLMVPIYLALSRDYESPVPAGIFAASVLFGWLHVRVWPSPIALTVLGLGLGWLAWRTRSLAGPIALHAVFNAVAVVVLLMELSE